MRVAGFSAESVVDGPGIRMVLFAQGCPHGCAECHNMDSWDCTGGYTLSVDDISKLIKKSHAHKQGVTFSGGEPFDQAGELLELVPVIRELGLDLWAYSGYTYEELVKDVHSVQYQLLCQLDVLVDGRYVHDLREMGLAFCGSSNQRLIAVRESLARGGVVLWEKG